MVLLGIFLIVYGISSDNILGSAVFAGFGLALLLFIAPGIFIGSYVAKKKHGSS